MNSLKKELKDVYFIKNKNLVDTGLNIIGKKNKKRISSIMGSEITLTNNETKDIMKVIRSLENRRILIKENTRKITTQEGGFLNSLRPLMTDDLPLMKSVFIPLVKSVFIPLRLSAGM